jgi:polyhydroxybutyrate depolymerase
VSVLVTLSAGVVAAGAAQAASGSSTLPFGSSSHTIEVDGLARTYLVYRPEHLAASAPLVVMLHGGYGSGAQAEHSYGWDKEADANHFVVAYPNGIDHVWNTDGSCCGKAAADNVNDVAFITDMVKAIEHKVHIDTSRVYATGISNGGILSYTLACTTDLFAAIGPDSATELAPCPSPHRLSVIHIHGTADPIIPYNGGPGQNIGAVIDGPSVPLLNATWRGIDGCAAPSLSTAGSVTTSVAACPSGRAVELISIAGAGHQWPGAIAKPLAERILHTSAPSTALNATAVIWRFFAAHPSTR